jgi:hypothetical protein
VASGIYTVLEDCFPHSSSFRFTKGNFKNFKVGVKLVEAH